MNRIAPYAIGIAIIVSLGTVGVVISSRPGNNKRSVTTSIIPGLIKRPVYELHGGFVAVSGSVPGVIMPPCVLDGNKAKLRGIVIIKIDNNRDIPGTTSSSFSQADQKVIYDGNWQPPGLEQVAVHYEGYADPKNRTIDREQCMVGDLKLDLSSETGNNAAIVTVKTDKNGKPISKSVAAFHISFPEQSASDMEDSPDKVCGRLLKKLSTTCPEIRQILPQQ